ncbi:MAG: hypothetical protein K2W95_20515 [Candidatus Obscuribacterales bacterium]|nr:hypothetical protein [Candidatus Obscuribacterales bacterium]
MSLSENLKASVHSAEKESVLKVLRSSGTPVRPAEVSQKTGLPVQRVIHWLNKIASETRGHLIVDTAGGVAYMFRPGFEIAYLFKGIGTFLQMGGMIALNAMLLSSRFFCLAMFSLLRLLLLVYLMLFVWRFPLVAGGGIMLVLLVHVVIRLLVAKGGNDNIRRFDFSRLFANGAWLRYWVFDCLWDWVNWPRYILWSPARPYAESSAETIATSDSRVAGTKTNFLDHCFEFLFGYGDPNADLEEKRWNIIVHAIQANRGVVIAEQLAPYVAETTVNEGWMPLILVRFNGRADVSDSGTIVYSFPEFQKGSADSFGGSVESPAAQSDVQEQAQNDQDSAECAATSLPAYLEEHEWKSGDLSPGALRAIMGFAGFSLFTGLILGFAGGAFPSYLAIISCFSIASLIYGLLFAVIPGIRGCVERHINVGIQKRNQNRFVQAQRILDRGKDERLCTRLEEAEAARAAGA